MEKCSGREEKKRERLPGGRREERKRRGKEEEKNVFDVEGLKVFAASACCPPFIAPSVVM